jgi:NAD+ synthase (glutamine-hydrolysing)
LEDDIYTNAWQMLLGILEDETFNDILLDIGMPVKHGKQRLNWQVRRTLVRVLADFGSVAS